MPGGCNSLLHISALRLGDGAPSGRCWCLVPTLHADTRAVSILWVYLISSFFGGGGEGGSIIDTRETQIFPPNAASQAELQELGGLRWDLG